MGKLKFNLILILIIFGVLICSVYAFTLPKWFGFNTNNALDEWQEKVFKDKVFYVVEKEQEGGYLLAKSNQACSGLLYRIHFHPRNYPMMSWKWKIIKFPEKNISKESQDGWLEKDDYPARVYVIFPSWIFTNIKCIEYVWDENLPVGTIMESPYSKNIKLIVAESGKKNAGQWIFEERNIYDDYQKTFKGYPGWVGAIAVMTDSDNTLSTAEAAYADIKVGYKNE